MIAATDVSSADGERTGDFEATEGGRDCAEVALIGVSFIPKTEARYKGSWPKVCWSGGSFVFFRFTLTCEPVAVWPAMMS